jgi:hypothetical protein
MMGWRQVRKLLGAAKLARNVFAYDMFPRHAFVFSSRLVGTICLQLRRRHKRRDY